MVQLVSRHSCVADRLPVVVVREQDRRRRKATGSKKVMDLESERNLQLVEADKAFRAMMNLTRQDRQS